MEKRKKFILQPRDERLLEELATTRVIERDQAKLVCGFGSVSRVNRRLLALVKAGFLKRLFLCDGPNLIKTVYFLTPMSSRLVGHGFDPPRRKNDEYVTKDYILPHQRAINRLYFAFKYSHLDGITFMHWESFHMPIDKNKSLIPDGFVEVDDWMSGSFGAFIEVDLGSERIPIWREKVKKYAEYRQSPYCQKRFGYERPPTLTITTSERRLHVLQEATFEVSKRFWFSTFAAIEKTGLWGPIWFKPDITTPQCIFGSSLRPWTEPTTHTHPAPSQETHTPFNFRNRNPHGAVFPLATPDLGDDEGSEESSVYESPDGGG